MMFDTLLRLPVTPDQLAATRREFLRRAAVAAAALGPLGALACGEQSESGGTTGRIDTTSGLCTPTSADMLGPYYRAGAPERSLITTAGENGTPLRVTGRVLGADCATLLTGALVEVWQADDSGAYDNTTAEFHLRGGVRTAADGLYTFDTILPGYYPGRPRHIHYKVSYERSPGDVVELVTQLYFEMDPTVPSSIDAARVIPLESDAGALAGVFDIALEA